MKVADGGILKVQPEGFTRISDDGGRYFEDSRPSPEVDAKHKQAFFNVNSWNPA